MPCEFTSGCVDFTIFLVFTAFAIGVSVFGFIMSKKEEQTILPAVMMFASASIFMFIFATVNEVSMGNKITEINSVGNDWQIVRDDDIQPLGMFKYYFLIVVAFLMIIGSWNANLFKGQGKGQYIDSL